MAGRGGGEERGEAAARPVPNPAISSWYHCSKSTAGGSSFSIWRGRGEAGRERKGQDRRGEIGKRERRQGREGKGRPRQGNGKEGLREGGGKEGRRKEGEHKKKEEKNSETTVALIVLRAKRNSQAQVPEYSLMLCQQPGSQHLQLSGIALGPPLA